MRHLLMHPAFPDIVGEWAALELENLDGPANDNGDDELDEFVEIFLLEIAKREIDDTRAW